MVITLMEYAIYLQAITAHNGDELDPHSGKLNTFPPLHNITGRHFLFNRLCTKHGFFYILFALCFFRDELLRHFVRFSFKLRTEVLFWE